MLCRVYLCVSYLLSSMEVKPKNFEVKSENIFVQVTILRLTKDNYLTWAAAIKMDIAGRGRIGYISGKIKPKNEDEPAWNQWYLEDN